MSVQSGVTTSSPVSQLAHSYPHSYNKYHELSGSTSTWNSNSRHNNQYIHHKPDDFKKQQSSSSHKRSIPYPTEKKKKPGNISRVEYDVCCKTFIHCTILIICGVLMILSRKLQNQSLTEYDREYLLFRHQWIQTWLFFLSKSLLIILVLFPCYNKSSGISQTYHSQILINHNIYNQDTLKRQSRHTRFKSICLQQLIYCILALCLVFGQFLLNIGLYYMSCSLWIIFLSLMILYISAFKFFLIEPSIIVFIGVFCIITGNIMMVSSEIHQLHIIADYNMTTCFFGFSSFCFGLLFITFYYMIYEYYYDEYREYINLLIKLKTLRKSKQQTFDESDFQLKCDIERNMVFYQWNHTKFIYMEGMYGLLFTSIIIAILINVNIENKIKDDSSIYYWLYENGTNFIHCLAYNPLNIAMLIIYMISVIINDITLEFSKSYLSSYHSKLIYFITILLVWGIDLLIHLIFTPNADKTSNYNNNHNVYYGERVTWYTALESGALLFIVLGITLFDEKYVVYINGMIEHNGLIIKQQRINSLTKYWNDIYYKKEKERLCGFSPKHLKITEIEYHDNQQIDITPHRLLTDSFDADNNNNNNYNNNYNEQHNIIPDESSYNYHELSVNSYNRDGTKLEGTINLLIGDGVESALKNGPSKYYPALYE